MRFGNKSIASRLFPFLSWLTKYKTSTLRVDAMARLTVAVVLVPQSMAYAMLAGLPPVYGLYAAATGCVIGALWGSQPQLATGPIAIVSFLVLTTLSPLADPGSQKYIELAFLLAFMVGVLYLIIGVFGMGVIISFISNSTVKGFTSAAAIIISITQLPNLFGIHTSRHEYLFQAVIELVKRSPEVHLQTLGIGVLTLAIIFAFKKYLPRFPGALVAIVAASVFVAIFHLDATGIAIVGECQTGLPTPMLPFFDLGTISGLAGPVVVIALVGFAETYAVGKTISNETKQPFDVEQEFIGQGLANGIGSFFQGYPVAGSFSRTAVNFASGAKTGMSSMITGAVVIASLLFLTPLFTYIPKAALAALVISAVMQLFHPKQVLEIWRMNRHDGVVALSVFVLALLTKPDYALFIGVAISLALFIWKTMHPRIVRLSKDPELDEFMNADVEEKPGCPQILMLRCDFAIYFANASYIVDHFLERVDEQDPPVKYLLLDLEGVGFIDLSGVDELRRLNEELKQRDCKLVLERVRAPVVQVFTSSGFLDYLDSSNVFSRQLTALSYVLDNVDHAHCRHSCPHSLFVECPSFKECSGDGA